LLIRAETEQAPISFLDVAKNLKLEGPSDWSVRVNDYLISGNSNVCHSNQLYERINQNLELTEFPTVAASDDLH
jgi:hypothetical protein